MKNLSYLSLCLLLLVSCNNKKTDWLYGYWQGTGEYENWWIKITPDRVFGTWFTPQSTDSETLEEWMSEAQDGFACDNYLLNEDGLHATGFQADLYGHFITIKGKKLFLNKEFGNSEVFELKKRAPLSTKTNSYEDDFDDGMMGATTWADIFDKNGLAVYDTGLVHTDRLGIQSYLILVFRPSSLSDDKTEGVAGLYKYDKQSDGVKYYQRYKFKYRNGKLCLSEGAVYNSSTYSWDTQASLSREQCFSVDESDFSFSGDFLNRKIDALRYDMDFSAYKGALKGL